MGLNIAPAYKIIANSQDVTAKIRERFRSLSLTDEAGDTSDTLEITLADHLGGEPIAIPDTGAELEVSIGYDGAVRPMGLFVVDEIELSGPPDEMVIRARAAPFTESKNGKSDLQSQKTRSWKAKTTIGNMVKKIASEHKLTPVVSSQLASIKLPHTDQAAESDMNLLTRLAKKYDAICKPGGGRLMFVVRGDSKTASGADMQTVTIARKDTSRHRVTIARRESAGTTVAFYRDNRRAKRHQVTVGSGEPVRRLKQGYKDQASAKAAAEAEQRKRAREEKTLTVDAPGNPDAVAESKVVLTGFRPGVDGEWLSKRVRHYIGPDGYRTSIECELSNADDGVSKSTESVEDSEQVGTDEGG